MLAEATEGPRFLSYSSTFRGHWVEGAKQENLVKGRRCDAVDRRTSPSGWAASQAHDALLLLGQVINRVRERLISLTPHLVMVVFRTLPDSLDNINLDFHHRGVRTKLLLLH